MMQFLLPHRDPASRCVLLEKEALISESQGMQLQIGWMSPITEDLRHSGARRFGHNTTMRMTP